MGWVGEVEGEQQAKPGGSGGRSFLTDLALLLTIAPHSDFPKHWSIFGQM